MVTPFPPSAGTVAPEPLEPSVVTGSAGATHSTRRRRARHARAADADGHSFPPGATSMATRNPVYTAFISGQKLCL